MYYKFQRGLRLIDLKESITPDYPGSEGIKTKMATDKKTIGISSLITLAIISLSMITPTFFDEQKYYCESESSIKECPGNLSGGTGTRCYLNEERTSWDYCKGGWVEVTNDLIIQEEPEEDTIPNPKRSGSYQCTPEGCVA